MISIPPRIIGLLLLAGGFAATGEPSMPAAAKHHPVKAGNYLVARRHLTDPFFGQTVVLLLEHGSNGTFGLIINRVTSVRLIEALPGLDQSGADHPLFFGGPVGVRRMSFISRFPVESGISVGEGLYFSNNLESLLTQLESPTTVGSLRVMAGHAAWAGGQLAAELERGDWYVTALEPETMFDVDAERLWENLINRLERPKNLAMFNRRS